MQNHEFVILTATLLLAAIQFANRISANLLDHVLYGHDLLAFAIFALEGAADEGDFDENVIGPVR